MNAQSKDVSSDTATVGVRLDQPPPLPPKPPATGATDYPEFRDGQGRLLPRSRARCSYCGVEYDRGDPEGSPLTKEETAHMKGQDDKPWVFYPKSQSAYWRHCITEDHQKVMRMMDRHQRQLLAELPQALAEAKKNQKQRASPAFQGIKELLG